MFHCLNFSVCESIHPADQTSSISHRRSWTTNGRRKRWCWTVWRAWRRRSWESSRRRRWSSHWRRRSSTSWCPDDAQASSRSLKQAQVHRCQSSTREIGLHRDGSSAQSHSRTLGQQTDRNQKRKDQQSEQRSDRWHHPYQTPREALWQGGR